MRITSITPMKDEAPFILEWVAYHRLIGINDPLVFTNHCSDGTDHMIERLDELGLVRHFANPSVFTGSPRHHWQVIRYANTLKRLARSDWVVSFDVDEFICINTGDGTMNALFEATHGANVISFNQHNFGSSGLVAYEDKPLIDQFQYAWKQEGAYNVRVAKRGVKTLTHKSAKPTYIANHSCNVAQENLDDVRYVNGSGHRLESDRLLKDVKSLAEPDFGFDLIQLNHYAIKSAESFLVQRERGNANHEDRAADMKYWRKYNHNDLHDTRIQRWSPRVAEDVAKLRKDPELNDLHQAAVEHHKNRVAALLKQDESVDLFNRVRKQQLNNPGIAPVVD